MKKVLLAIAAVIISSGVYAQKSNWTVDASHSNVKFSVTHMVVSEVEGTFKTYEGSVSTDNADFNDATINFTVDVNSVNTDNADREKHLKSDDFFNAEKFPKMTFKSVSFKKVSGNKYMLEGDLTIRDVTKRVKFDVTYGGTVKDPWGNIKAGFKASGIINRKDYKLQWSAVTEAGGLVVSDEVAIALNIELLKSK
ncbi:YceI family protein [soil metagenome]